MPAKKTSAKKVARKRSAKKTSHTAKKAATKKTATKRAAKKAVAKKVARKQAVKKTARKAATKKVARKRTAKKATRKAIKKTATRRSTRPSVAVVGVGRMGANMARRLKDCGYEITAVYDKYRPGAKALAKELGCQAETKLTAVTAAADIIVTVVTNDAAMKKIFSAKKDNLLQKAEGKIFINCATVAPGVHRDIEKLARKAGAKTLEGCMASSIPQARSGTLYLMVGGDEAVFSQVKPLLSDLSKDLTYVGQAGKAAEVKALVNMVMNSNTAALAEGLGLGKALGLDLKMLCQVFSQTGANSRVLETDAEDMIQRDHDCFFSAAHAAKDSGIALDMAKKKKLKLPVAKATRDQYAKLVQHGLGELDKSGVAELTFPGRSPKKKAKKK